MPIGAGAIFILLINGNRNLVTYFVAVMISAIVAIITGSIGVITQALIPLPIIIAGGIYLRILNWKFSSRDITLPEKGLL